VTPIALQPSSIPRLCYWF